MNDNRVFQEVDILNLIKSIGRKNRAVQAKLLQYFEETLEPEKFQDVRKVLMDAVNDYTRDVVKLIFGDIESLLFTKR